jgi:hypothetical protein
MFAQSIKFIPRTRSESDLQAVLWHLAQVSSHERTLSQSQILCTGWQTCQQSSQLDRYQAGASSWLINQAKLE